MQSGSSLAGRGGRRLAAAVRVLAVVLVAGLIVPLACNEQYGGAQAPPQGAVGYDASLPLLLEYGRSTCPWCRKMKPILGELARTYRGKLNVSSVNVDEQAELARRAGVRLLPTIIIYKPGGEEIARHVGFWPKDEIVAKLRELGISL